MADLIYEELELFAICLLLGAALAAFYDGVRIFRMLFRHANWLVDLEDLAYWILTGWMVFKTLFYFNRGALRGYAFLGLILGVVIYVMTLSHLILFLTEKMLPFWNKGKGYLKKPFTLIFNFIRKALKNIIIEVKMAVKGR